MKKFILTFLNYLLNIFKINKNKQDDDIKNNKIEENCEKDPEYSENEIEDQLYEKVIYDDTEKIDIEELTVMDSVEKKLITEQQFKKVFPRADINFAKILNSLLIHNNINTYERVSCFLAQCGHESGEFTIFSENLNYSATALLKVFGKYFNQNNVYQYARKPEKIANRVYANRMGNGPESSGDGWKYRGRGLIQLTGKNNYIRYAEDRNISLDTIIEYCETSDGIVDSAIWYWIKNNCNDYADNGDFKGLTKRINGGYNGLDHRLSLYNKLKEVIKDNF